MSSEALGSPYDVFLCHNSRDKDAVRTINEILRQEYGLATYLDEATLVGGEAWEQAIQNALARSKTCAVIVGPHGWGKYQLDNEARPAVKRRDADRSFRVIPVLLPGVNVESLADFSEFFSRTHWVTFHETPDEVTAIRTLAYALRGENAFPEGPPRLTASRVRFDAIRWDAGSRHDESLLYTGHVLRDAARLVEDIPTSLVADFISASRRYHNLRVARQLGSHAGVMWNNPRRRDLAARLALESVRHSSTAEGLGVLREAYAHLHTSRGALTHPAPVTTAARDAGRERLATGCSDGSVCLWDGTTLRLVGKHGQVVRAIADLGNGSFVTGAADGAAIVWDWTTGNRVREFRAGTTLEKFDARRTAEGTRLLTSGGIPGSPGEVAVWNGDDGAELWRMGMVTDAAFDADATNVALAWGDHVALRRVSDGALGPRLPLNAAVIGVATDPSQPWLAATTFDRRAYLVSFESDPPERRDLGTGTSRVSPIRISRNGRYVAAVRDDFRIAIWDLMDGTRQLVKSEGLIGVDIQFSDESLYLAVVSPEATAVTVWSPESGQHVCTIEQDQPSLALFDDRGNGLWTASQGAVVSYVQMPRQNAAFSTATPGITQALSYGPDGTLAWSGTPVSRDLRMTAGEVALWVVNPLTGATRLDTMLSEPSRIAFDADGHHVAAVGKERVRVWNLATGEELQAPPAPFWLDDEQTNAQQAIAALLDTPSVAAAGSQRGRVGTEISRDRRFAAIDHGKQLVSLWNAPAATEIVKFSTVAAVACMAFSGDGALFATGDARGGVMFWQTDGTFLGQVQHDEPISHLAFSPDGTFLAVASLDSALRVWIAAPSVLAENIRAKASGPLTDEEWTRYLGDEPRMDQ
jgi:WD40 repeat protein